MNGRSSPHTGVSVLKNTVIEDREYQVYQWIRRVVNALMCLIFYVSVLSGLYMNI